MKILPFIYSVLIILTFSMCKQNTTLAENPTKTSFGESFEVTKVMTIPQVLTQLATQDSTAVQMKASVSSVCQVKGCWMNLESKDTDQSFFVKFKDYGFFMPLDLAGQEVIVNGYAYKELTTVEELKHYAEDEGLSKAEIEKITEPKEEYKIMASGVRLAL